MSLRTYIAGVAKRVLRTFNNVSHSPAFVPKKSRAELHSYWKEPYDGSNQPEGYLTPASTRRSEYLVEVVKEHLPADARILEVGCNVGRNLNFLNTAGYSNLSGIEISENAVRMLRASYPSLAAASTIHNRPLEKVIRTFSDRQFDLVFTMAVLEHIHYESEWTFKEMSRISSKYLLTVEDEGCQSWRHFPRNYRSVFEPLGWKQVREQVGESVIGLGGSFVARLFVRG